MSRETFSQPYHCPHDCQPSGCPGHTLAVIFDGSSDTVALALDGVIHHVYGHDQFAALLRAVDAAEAQWAHDRLTHPLP